MPLLATSGAAVGAAALLVVALAAQRGAQPADARAATAKAFGHKALALLATADYPALVPYTCAPGGLGFSPYARNLSSVSPVALSADELLQFKGDVKRRVWGRYDGSGADIALTPMDYHRQFVYDADYRGRAKVSERSVADLKGDAELAALAAAYPGAGLVIYRDPGSQRNDYKDARELILVIRPAGAAWCLQALSHSEDTV